MGAVGYVDETEQGISHSFTTVTARKSQDPSIYHDTPGPSLS